MISKSDFRRLNNPPKNYIPGISRGDTGFITRTDIGASREAQKRENDNLVELQKQLQNRSANATDPVNFNDDNFDKWQGFINFKLTDINAVSAEDKEADEVFDKVERALDAKIIPKKKLNAGAKLPEKDQKSLKELFAKEKDELKNLKAEDWLQIPEPNIAKSKRNDKEKYTPNTDANLMEAVNKNNIEGIVIPDATARGNSSTINGSISMANQTGIGQMSIIERAGIMSKINANQFSDYSIQDISKARLLFASLRESDPKNYKAWVASARLEELSGRAQEALNILNTGASLNPYSEDIYIELVRLSPKNKQESIVNKALKFLGDSHTLWQLKIAITPDQEEKFAVTLKALEFCKSVEGLWKQAVELADSDDKKKVLLRDAVTNLPESVDLWLAYAKLSTYENAKKILNKASKLFDHSDIRIWMAAASLEETAGEDPAKIIKIVQRAFSKIVEAADGVLDKEGWFREAVSCMNRQSIHTGAAMMRSYAQYITNQFLDDWESLYKTLESDAAYFSTIKSVALVSELIVELFNNVRYSMVNRLSLYSLLFEMLNKSKEYESMIELIAKISSQKDVEAYNYGIEWLNKLNDQGSISSSLYLDKLIHLCQHAIQELISPEDREGYVTLLADAYVHGLLETGKAIALTDEHISSPAVFVYNSTLKLQINFASVYQQIIASTKEKIGKTAANKGSDVFKLTKLLGYIYSKQLRATELQQLWATFLSRYPTNQLGLVELSKIIKKHQSPYQFQAMVANILKRPNLTLQSSLSILRMIPASGPELQNALRETRKKFPNAFVLKVIELQSVEKPEKSKVVELLKEDPDSVEMQIYMAESLIKENKIEKAKAWLLSAYSKAKNNSLIVALLYFINSVLIGDALTAEIFSETFQTQLRFADEAYNSLREEHIFDFQPHQERFYILNLMVQGLKVKLAERND